jgi:hypothetical protein
VEARTVVVDAYFMIGAQVRGLIIVDFMQSYFFLLYLSCFLLLWCIVDNGFLTFCFERNEV